jgi:undecaprenyl-diphosphatase
VFQKSTYKIFAIVLFLVLILGFITLSVLVYGGKTASFDTNLIQSSQSFIPSYLTKVMILVSFFGDGFYPLILFLAFGLLLIKRGYKRETYFSFLIWLGPILSWSLKLLIARPRPQEFLVSSYSLPSDSGFPSGHAVFFVVFFGLVTLYALVLPKLSALLKVVLIGVSVSLVLLIGISRVSLGVHWPVDVFAGYLLGFALLEILTISYLRFIRAGEKNVTG